MAITIHQSPQKFTPSDNPVNFVFSSTQTGQPNFAFFVELIVNGATVAEELVFPENANYGRYDASAYASNACSAPTLPTGFYGDAENTCSLYIKVWDYYGATPAKQGSSVNSSVIYPFKAGLQNEDFIDYDHNDYLCDGVASENWLSSFPGGQGGASLYPKVKREDEKFFIMAMNDNNNLPDFEIELYNSAGGLVASWSSASLATASYRMTIFDMSPATIIANTTITQENFDASAYMVFYSTGWLTSYRVNFDDSCQYPRRQRMHFITNLGSIEAFTFEMVSQEMADITSHGYKRNFGEWNGTTWEYNKERGIDIDYMKYVSRRMTIESNWIEENTQHWLVKNLYSAPLVLQEVGSILIERKINTASYAFKYFDNHQLFNEIIEIELPSHRTMTL